MPKIVILPHQDLCPDDAVLEAEADETILDVTLCNGIEIEHACEKSCTCTTYHCVVREDSDSPPENTEEEDDMLDRAWRLEPENHSSCQARIIESDLVVETPRCTVSRVRGH